MSNVLIVSRTKMSNNNVCVSGIVEETGESIRIHTSKGGNLHKDSPYQIGDRWEMIVESAWNARQYPHTEDRNVTPIKKIGNINLKEIANFVSKNGRVVKGSISDLFNKVIIFEGVIPQSGFITPKSNNVPDHSVEFWISDTDLIKREETYEGKKQIYYLYSWYKIKYVGFQEAIDNIPKGTVIRISLANWWKKDPLSEERCYLQLSGWYL